MRLCLLDKRADAGSDGVVISVQFNCNAALNSH